MSEWIKAIIFGLVEGITEWLPISSTGHLILLNEVIRLEVSEEFYRMFEVVVQLGAILAVVVLFWKEIFPFSFGQPGKQDDGRGRKFLYVHRDICRLWAKILLACIPAGVIGILFQEEFEQLFYRPVSVALALILFGIGFLVIEQKHKGQEAKVNTVDELPWNTALMIGVFQLIAAIFPGTSRSGATLIGALLMGVSRKTAAEFTFFLAIPVMFGASLLKLLSFGFSFSASEQMILVLGMGTAFISSVLVIRFLLAFVKKHDFKLFGWYRILLGVLVLWHFSHPLPGTWL